MVDVLITHKDQEPTLTDAVQSIRSQLDPSDEIHVVDAGSTDGSLARLRELDDEGEISLTVRDGVCRGVGRQLAFEQSNASTVFAHLDLDAAFEPVLPELAAFYRRLRDERGPGLLLFHGGFVGSRDVIERAGGWRALQVHEDKDLWLRVSGQAPIAVLPVSILRTHRNFEWTDPRYRIRRVYYNYRDAIRLGVSRSSLRRSSRIHRSGLGYLRDRLLLEAAVRGARRHQQYGVLDSVSLPGRSHFLRELTFDALVESGALTVHEPTPPPALESYVTVDGYPGQTSYSTD